MYEKKTTLSREIFWIKSKRVAKRQIFAYIMRQHETRFADKQFHDHFVFSVMELSTSSLLAICGLFFAVAMLYSSVGHGGASGYLAVLSFFAVSPKSMSTTGLILNLFVASIAFITFYRAGHFSLPLTWPFLVASIPAAFLGGMITVPKSAYALLLALALAFAALRLMIQFRSEVSAKPIGRPSLPIMLVAGAGIGLISGIVGVGGGIFLSPLILLLNWAHPQKTSATSAIFILVNSLAGLVGRFFSGSFEIGMLAPFVLAAFLGGLAGANLGANKFSSLTLRRALGVVLIIAAYKLIVVML